MGWKKRMGDADGGRAAHARKGGALVAGVRRLTRGRLARAVAIGVAGCASLGSASSDHGAVRHGELGLVITTMNYAMNDDGMAEDCPDGLNVDNIEQWKAQFPSAEAQGAHLRRGLGRNNRGPNGENACYAPTLVKDLLPFKEAQSRVVRGENLDGVGDNVETPTGCAHKNFQAPSGAPGIDNQLYRAIGCIKGYRKTGFSRDFPNGELRSYNEGRILVQVTGVDDERNDPSVRVDLYKGRNNLTIDAQNEVVAWTSQEIDPDPRYRASLSGRIEDGVLITDPADVRIPVMLATLASDYVIKGMRLRVKLADDGASGLMSGYTDLSVWWSAFSRAYGGGTGVTTGTSCPSLYEAIHRLADGYRDPKTGACTAISSSLELEMKRAFIIPARDERRAASRFTRTSRQD